VSIGNEVNKPRTLQWRWPYVRNSEIRALQYRTVVRKVHVRERGVYPCTAGANRVQNGGARSVTHVLFRSAERELTSQHEGSGNQAAMCERLVACAAKRGGSGGSAELCVW